MALLGSQFESAQGGQFDRNLHPGQPSVIIVLLS